MVQPEAGQEPFLKGFMHTSEASFWVVTIANLRGLKLVIVGLGMLGGVEERAEGPGPEKGPGPGGSPKEAGLPAGLRA